MGSICSSIGLCCTACLHCEVFQTYRAVKKAEKGVAEGNEHLKELQEQFDVLLTQNKLFREQIQQMQGQPPKPPGDGSGGGGAVVTLPVVGAKAAELQITRELLADNIRQLNFLRKVITNIYKGRSAHELTVRLPAIRKAQRYAMKGRQHDSLTYQAVNQETAQLVMMDELATEHHQAFDETLKDVSPASSTEEDEDLFRGVPELQGYKIKDAPSVPQRQRMDHPHHESQVLSVMPSATQSRPSNVLELDLTVE